MRVLSEGRKGRGRTLIQTESVHIKFKFLKNKKENTHFRLTSTNLILCYLYCYLRLWPKNVRSVQRIFGHPAPCQYFISVPFWMLPMMNFRIEVVLKCHPSICGGKLGITVLEQRQYKNDSTEFRCMFILKLPLFFTT